MKYINNKIVCGALSMLTLLGTTSCGEEFLKEDAGHMVTDALLEDELSLSCSIFTRSGNEYDLLSSSLSFLELSSSFSFLMDL